MNQTWLGVIKVEANATFCLLTGLALAASQTAYPRSMIDISQFGQPKVERYSVDPVTALFVERTMTGHVSSIQLTVPTYPSVDYPEELLKSAQVNRIVDQLVPGLSALKPAFSEKVSGSNPGVDRVIRRASGVVLTYDFLSGDDEATMVSARFETTEPDDPRIDSRTRDLTMELGLPTARWFLDSSGAVIEVEESGESVRKAYISANGPFIKPTALSDTLDETQAESLLQRLLPGLGTYKEQLGRYQMGG